jgi:CBS domain-containing protein
MPRNTPVRDVMTVDVVSFSLDEPIQDACNRLLDANVDGGPVVDGDGHVVGILTADELIVQEAQLHYPTVVALFGAYLELPSSHRRFEEELRRAVGANVSDVMRSEPITCGPDDTLERAATLMHDHHISRLPVTEAGKLVGIIARGDILRAVMGRG